ncbi:MAG: DUF4198 domain-containing protein [Arenibacterium sp.]
MFKFAPILSLFLLLCNTAPAFAHEFWIEAEEYRVQPGQNVVAHLRNGEFFHGNSVAYFERRTARFEAVQDGTRFPIAPRMGDIPAIDMTASDPGLLVLVHETEAATLKYTEWQKFLKFAEHKDFPDIELRHAERDIPQTGFTETYRRFAKALVAVGDGKGRDIETAMETEFVALANPYTDPLPDGFPVQLLYQGSPRANAQIEIFEKSPEGEVDVTLLRSDREGKALVPVKQGYTYLIDAVVLREVEDDPETVWETLWAALTFAVP